MTQLDNFFQYALKHYDNPKCKTIEEFTEDLNKFKYIKKLLNRGTNYDIRLLLNHIIVLYNVFESEACTKMLFHKVEKEHWSVLKTYLVYLNYMPDTIPELNIISSNIPLDQRIVKELRML